MVHPQGLEPRISLRRPAGYKPDALTIELRVHASVSNSTASTYSLASSGIIVCIEAGLEPARVAYDASQAIARPVFAHFTIP